jgi:hypothetical protein
VNLSSEDLAKDELRKERQEIAALDAESRRSDWLDDNKEVIHKDIGLDPNNTWEYSDGEESLASQF